MTVVATSDEQGSCQQQGFWPTFQQAASLANYRPEPAVDIVVAQHSGFYVLKNPNAGTYMRLSPEEHTLWTWMDGQRTVQELAVSFFLQHQRLMPVAELVRRLRGGHMLADPPSGVWTQLQSAVERQQEPWGRRVLAFLWGHPLYVKGTDHFFRTIYQLGGRFLFARPLIVLQAFVALIGFAAFVFLLATGRQGYEVFQLGQSYFWGLLLLLLLNTLTLSLHESIHALATIHSGCEVRRGGFMLYLFLPTLFVDTTDTWMVGKEGRIQVAIAGPWNDLFLGGLCALLSLPSWGAGPLCLKIAMLAYASALFNLNPLLELDGYYALCDTLDLPTLRRDALAFVRRGLWERVFQRESLSQRERFYTIYGLLSLLYLVVVVGLAILFWRTQVTLLLSDLLGRGLWGWIIIGLLAALIGGPLLVLVGSRLYRAGRRFWRSMAERGLLTRSSVRLFLVGLGTLVLLGLFRLLPPLWQREILPFVPLLLYAISLLSIVAVIPFYEGTRFRRALVWLGIFVLLLGLSSTSQSLWGKFALSRDIVRLAQVAVLLIAVMAFSRQDLVRTYPLEGMLMSLLIGGGFIMAVVLAHAEGATGSILELFRVAGPPFLAGLTLAILVPTVTSFATTPFAPSWQLFFLAFLLHLARQFWGTDPIVFFTMDLGTAFLMAQGGLLYRLSQRYLLFRGREWTEAVTISTHQQLRHAFVHFFSNFFLLFQGTFGQRKTRILDDRLDIIAVTANWFVTVDGGRIRENVEIEDRSLEEISMQYVELFERTVDIMDELAGRPFLQRAIQSAYDSLPWTGRRMLTHWVLEKTPWGEAISHEFFARQDEDLRLLAGVPLLFGCDETTLSELRASLQTERVGAGQVIARQGDSATALHIVAAGEVEVWQKDEEGQENLIGELHRGGTFGEDALLSDQLYRATYRASVHTTLFRAEGAILERVLEGRSLPTEQLRARARLLSWMTGLELFQGLPWKDLQKMVVRMQHRQKPAWERIINEGEPTKTFYLIERGKVLIVSGWGSTTEKIEAELGPGEYFGEVSPFLGGGATATVLATEPCTFWTLPAQEFHQFLERSLTGYGPS
jgi:putative peptide zinc metalloprotease protein